MATTRPKILHVDIETAPANVYAWGSFKQYISPEQVITPDHILCWAAKWHGKKGMKFGALWKEGPPFIKDLADLITQADAVVTYNGDKFDLPRIKGAMVRNSLPPLPPVTSIDLYKSVRRLGFFSGKLAYVAPMLGLGGKVKHHGFGLWRDVLAGDAKALRLMERYNKQDVKLLEDLYTKLLPHIAKHPRLGPRGVCTTCGGSHLQHRGSRRTVEHTVERLQCQDCGHWNEGKRTKT